MCPEEEAAEAARELRTGRWYQVPVRNIVRGATHRCGCDPRAWPIARCRRVFNARTITSEVIDFRTPAAHLPGTGTGSSNPTALWARVH